MIRIKDYIFNENEIEYIRKGKTLEGFDALNLKSKNKDILFENATFEDIEWNYGATQETQRKMQKELCKSCYYRNTISNKLKELEEKYDKALTELAHESHKRIELEEENENLQQRIDKAIKYLKLKVDIPKNHLEEAIKIIGEENE